MERVARTNVELARLGYERFSSRDLDGWLELMHPDVDWGTSGLFPGLRDRYVGHADVIKFFEAFMEAWESMDVEVLEVREVPGGVLLHIRFHARGRDGIEVSRPLSQHMEFEEGKLRRLRSWAEWPDALRAVGLDP
jgi:ketosteroid isomerase-like protein